MKGYMYAVEMSQQTYEVSGQSPSPHLYAFLTIHDLIAPWRLRGSAAGSNPSNVCSCLKTS